MNKKQSTDALNRPDLEEYLEQTKLPLVLVLDDIRSLSNVGSVFRTSDAFNIEKIILCGITGRPPHRDIQRTALGATESVRWEYQPSIMDCLDQLDSEGYRILTLEQCERSSHPKDMKLATANRYALIIGNEVEGVKQEVVNRSHDVIEIPQSGTKHSLNVTVAAGIAMWEIYAWFSRNT